MGNRAEALNIAQNTMRGRASTGVVLRRLSRSEQGGAGVRSLFEELPVGVCLIDRSMRVVLWNPAAAEITGYGASELLGCRCYLKRNRLALNGFAERSAPSQQRINRRQAAVAASSGSTPGPWSSPFDT